MQFKKKLYFDWHQHKFIPGGAMRHISLGDDLDTNVVKLHRFINTLRPRQHGRHLTDNIFECIFLNENV